MSTEATRDKGAYNIKKLDNEGLNYSSWATHCEMVLEALDLWDVVDPNTPIPTPPAPPASSSPGKAPSTLPPDPVTAEWAKKNKKALSLISLLVEDTPIKIVKGKLTAKGAWKALAE